MSIWKGLTVAALVPWLAVSASLAPEHVHESDAPDHHAAAAHRHVAPHERGGAALSDFHDDDFDRVEVSEADEHVVWIDDVGITQAPRAFPQLVLVVAIALDGAYAAHARAGVVAPDEATLPHGPPRVSRSLRAPPPAFL